MELEREERGNWRGRRGGAGVDRSMEAESPSLVQRLQLVGVKAPLLLGHSVHLSPVFNVYNGYLQAKGINYFFVEY